MTKVFKTSDLKNFWLESEYASKTYTGSPIVAETIRQAESELGYMLPLSYIELISNKNGGIPKNTCFPSKKKTCWANDHVAISGIHGINDHELSLLGKQGSRFMIEEWGYPSIGIVVCDTPTGGHDAIMLDYRKRGKGGEPVVVHVDVNPSKPKITLLADSFELFIKGLVNESVFFPPVDEELQSALAKVSNGSFSSILVKAFSQVTPLLPDAEHRMRLLLAKLVKEKNGLYIHKDELSMLVRDYFFWLFSQTYPVESMDRYIDIPNSEDALTTPACYKYMVDFAHKTDPHEIRTGGFIADAIKFWWNDRVEKQWIEKTPKGYVFTDSATVNLMGQLEKFR